MSLTSLITEFFSSKAYAVVGASSNRHKFGNKVLRCYLQHHKTVYPVNPHESMIESLTAVKSIADLPEEVNSISIITPPKITEQIVNEAIQKGIKNIWMQPGAESQLAVKQCLAQGINVIYGGPCLLVELGFKDI
ncbi:CoA-binding protein [Legionella jordanis]|uniref:CoA-binding protein n=1 Tax=Legionella jordanis TaxID=456 RepID=A0A0W0VCM5_9GAMM|nr:CoA-binding protein [Legionella jordanis]KTD17839.1 CoA-binding protein [Legionella jordanis]RMX02460.1 CoA-binding protein [Legionella jordanis]RMX21697.1 CoA-binding protein [Legionella jordanis]VEH11224.1 CoA-binding protein [Legionella jordanis]HAT8713808.1 CoA-binding protein [Legionella jordanis]